MIINDIPLQSLKDILASDTPLAIQTTEALIARLEQAEKQAAANDRTADELLTDRDYWEAKLTNLVYSLATEEEVGEWSSMNDIADNVIEHIGGKIQNLEQAVARVRALCMSTDDDYLDNEETVNTVGDILEALDGEPNG